MNNSAKKKRGIHRAGKERFELSTGLTMRGSKPRVFDRFTTSQCRTPN